MIVLRIGVLSDTHGRVELALKAIAQMGSIDMLIHAGDHYEDAMNIKEWLQIPVEAVKGNCDHFLNIIDEKTIELEGKKLLLTHGHKYNVKNNYLNLKYKAQELGVDIVVFGHTHVSELIVEDNIIMFNPGSIALPRLAKAGTYGIIEIANNKISPYITEILSQ